MPSLKIFGMVDRWFKDHNDWLKKEHTGKYLLINASDLTRVSGATFDEACKEYKKRYGPTPPNGRSFLGQQF